MTPLAILKSCVLFIVAGLFEIGGGYLVWLWRHDHRGVLYAAIGGLILFGYGIIPTFQSAGFGRVYAAYGGWFVVLSLLWGWLVDKQAPDSYDIVGGVICLLGVAVIMYWPR